MYTRRAGGGVWSYPNLHGDIAATADDTGLKQGAIGLYDPYGQPLSVLPDNQTGMFDYGWVGQHQRPAEHADGITPVIEMGVRIYQPSVGRFLQVDRLEGGTSNAYTYVDDPSNYVDLTGMWTTRAQCEQERRACVQGAINAWDACHKWCTKRGGSKANVLACRRNCDNQRRVYMNSCKSRLIECLNQVPELKIKSVAFDSWTGQYYITYRYEGPGRWPWQTVRSKLYYMCG